MLETHPSAGPPVVFVQQLEPVDDSQVRQRRPVRALLGACLLGTLEHYGQRDHEANGTTTRENVRLVDLRRVVIRDDKGLHGCGFEYAVHEAINGESGIPEAVRSCVSSVVSAEVGAMYERLGVPFIRWTPAVKSVMFAVEKQHRDPERLRVRSQLGDGALIWAAAGQNPHLLGPLLPLATCSSFSRPPRIAQGGLRSDDPNLPEELSHMWKADLFLGGAVVESTQEVAALVGDETPTAWVSATVKYTARRVIGGPGLHLGLQSSYLPRGKFHGLVVDRSRHDGLSVLTLPLDGDFVRTFNRAWRTLDIALRRNLTRHAHPAYVAGGDRALVEELGTYKDHFVVDIAHDLLRTGQSGIATRVVQPIPSPGDGGPGIPLMAPVPLVLPAAA